MFFIVLLFSFFISQGVHAEEQDVDLLKRQIEELKRNFNEFSKLSYENQGSIQAFFANSLSLGGFFENSITSLWGPDTKSQTVADTHRLGLNFSAEMSAKVRIVAQNTVALNYAFRNPHNNPNHSSTNYPTQRTFSDITFGSLLSQGFIEYKISPLFSIQLGLGYTPFGRAFQVRDPVLFKRYRGPQMIRTNGVVDIIIADPFWKGINISGDFLSNWGYNIYTTSPLKHRGNLGGGSRLWWLPISWLKLGTSLQLGNNKSSSYIANGIDLELNFSPLSFIAEYAINNNSDANVTTYYTQLNWEINEDFFIYIDYDFLKNPLGLTTFGTQSISDPYVKTEYGFGVNYWLDKLVKLRLQYLFHSYSENTSIVNGQNRDYQSISFSTGATF